MKSSFWGYSKENQIPFLLKIIVFIIISAIALLNFINIYFKLALILLLIISRHLLLNKKEKYGIYIFLIISSVMIILFWFLFERDIFLKSGVYAIAKLWLLFLSGNVLLLSISQDELIKNSLKFNISENAILLLIVSLNSINYFMESFKTILKSYEARNSNRNILKKYYNCLLTIAIDTLFLMIECKKVYTIYYAQIISSLRTREVV